MNKIVSNYIRLIILVVGVIVFTLLVCNIYKNFEGRKSNSSYLTKYVANGDYTDISSMLTEMSNEQYIYISYIGDKNIYNFEKDLKKVLKKYDLLDSIIMIDATDEVDSNGLVESLNRMLKVNTKQDIMLPAIIYYKNSEPVDYIDSSEGFIGVDRFVQLMDKWEVNE